MYVVSYLDTTSLEGFDNLLHDDELTPSGYLESMSTSLYPLP